MGNITHALLEGRFEDAGEAIESKFKAQAERIEALEKTVKKLDLDTFFETIPPEPMPPDVPTEKDWKETLSECIDRAHKARREARQVAAKDPVPTDKDGKPDGGLERGDVLEYHSPRYQKRIGVIFIGQTSEQRHSGWIEAYRVCDGEVAIIDIELDECKFKFRPRFPDRKES